MTGKARAIAKKNRRWPAFFHKHTSTRRIYKIGSRTRTTISITMNASTSRAALWPARQASRAKLLLPARPSLRPPSNRVATPSIPRRTLFSLPDITKLANLASAEEGETPDLDRDLQRFHSRKILPYSQAQLYSIVANVPSYSSFIPFCTASTIVSRRDGSRQEGKWESDDRPFDVDAELVVGFGGMEERFISRVEGRPFESVTVSLTFLKAQCLS